MLYDIQRVKFIETETNKPVSINSSLGFGLGIEQGLFRSFGLSYDLDFTRKYITGDLSTVFDVYGFKFHQIRNALFLKYYAHEKIHFGIGVSHAVWFNTLEISEPGLYTLPNSSRLSISSSARIKLQPITLDFYITKWLASEIYNPAYIRFDSMSFGLKLGYPIQLFKKREVSKVRCPKF